MSQQPSGWYDDPSNAEMLRYWDGVTWTNHTAPKRSPTAPQPMPGQARQSSPAHSTETAPVPHGGWQGEGGWQGHDGWQRQGLPQATQYPPQYHPYGQAPGAAGWAAALPSTTDGVPLASWGKRFLAWLLDGVLITVVVNILTPLLIPDYDGAVARITTDLEQALVDEDEAALREVLTGFLGLQLQASLVAFVIASVYAIAFWTTTAQTPGKMATGISVRHMDRPGPLTLGTAIKRRIVALLAVFVPFLSLFDGLWPLWDAKRQALHDKVARTQVVEGKQPRKRT